MLVAALYFLVERTWFGKSMRATAEDRDAARMMGVDIDGIIRNSFFARLCTRRHRRSHERPVLPVDTFRHGLGDGDQGLHRGRAGRPGQCLWRRGGRLCACPARGADSRAGPAGLAIQGRIRFSHSHPRPGVPALGNFPAAHHRKSARGESPCRRRDFIVAQVTANRPDRQRRLRDSAIIGAVLLGLGAFFVIGMAIERLPIFIGFVAAITVLGVLYRRRPKLGNPRD